MAHHAEQWRSWPPLFRNHLVLEHRHGIGGPSKNQRFRDDQEGSFLELLFPEVALVG